MAQISQNDQRITDRFEPEVFWQEHGKKFLFIVGAIVVLGVGILAWQRQRSQEAEEAATALAAATDENSLQSVISKYSGNQAAVQAMFKLAEIYYRDGRYADAASTYKGILNGHSHHQLVEGAWLGLAAVEETLGNMAAARGQYAQIVASYPNGYTAQAAKMGLARCAEKIGLSKEARQSYEELMAAAQGSPWQSEAYVRWVVLSRERPASIQEQPMNNPLPLPEPEVTGDASEPASEGVSQP